MSNFKDHKISASQLLGLIPQDLLSQLSLSTHVDHYTKVLHGIKCFICWCTACWKMNA